jgi:uncharacterized protein YjbI with pentapeptide repeats
LQTLPERGITIPLTPQEAWGLLIMAGIILGAVLIVLILPKAVARGQNPLDKMRAALGLTELPKVIVLLSTALWLIVLLTLLGGLLWTIVQVAVQALPQPRNVAVQALPQPRSELLSRLPLLTLAGLTATLGAVIALPFTLIKRLHSARQTDATEEGLITDRINTAVLGLGLEKTVKRPVCDAKGDPIIKDGTAVIEEITAPNIEVRVGAILALERLAKNNLGFHVQIMQILCTYIRANAPAKGAAPVRDFPLKAEEQDGPWGDDQIDRLNAWRTHMTQALANATPREDITTAMQVIGRRTARQREIEAESGKGGKGDAFAFDIPCPEPPQPPEDFAAYEQRLDAWKQPLDAYQGYRLDLRHTNLQKLDMSGLNFAGARFDAAQMQGGNLFRARMQGARLSRAQMQGAWLSGAQMQGAWLEGAQMQGALLNAAQMQGAWLNAAQMKGAWLTSAQMQGALLEEAQMQGALLDGAQMQGARLNAVLMDATTSLTAARLRGAAVREVDLSNVPISPGQIQSLFGDGSVILPGGKGPTDDGWPKHWPNKKLGFVAFHESWREWQKNHARPL